MLEHVERHLVAQVKFETIEVLQKMVIAVNI